MARSPNYPGIDLGAAVDRAQRLWGQQQAHAAPTEVVMKHLGYAPRSGPGSTTYGALKRFGLLDEPERGHARLSELGLEIVRAENADDRDYAKLRDAALHPKLHKTMWRKYKAQLPADTLLEFDLQKEGFTPSGAKEFIRQWKRTMAFARLADAPDTVSGDGEKPEDQTSGGMSSMTSTETEAETTTHVDESRVKTMQAVINIPLDGREWATLTTPMPLTERRWEQIMRMLDAAKPGLVEQTDDS
jgi:hypothetical protein